MMMLLLFATGLFAGTVDAIAGGGGLISLPVLLSIGMPPHLAFGTNKLQSTIGTFIAARRYHRQGWISLEIIYHGVIFGLVGSIAGAVLAETLSTQVLYKIIPILLTLILFYSVLSPKLGTTDTKPRMSEFWFFCFFGFGLGFYDGFFGPGVGSFWVFFLTFFLGYNLVKATAYTKVFNLNSSFIAMLCFVMGGNVNYRIALCMAAGQFIGGRLGANLAIKNGARLIRPLFLAIVSVTISVMIYKSYESYESSAALLRFAQEYHVIPQLFVGLCVLTGAYLYYRRKLRKAN